MQLLPTHTSYLAVATGRMGDLGGVTLRQEVADVLLTAGPAVVVALQVLASQLLGVTV